MTDFNIENADCELDDVENLLSVFWKFFDQACPDTASVARFMQNRNTYGSLFNAAWDKIRLIHADMITAIKQHYHSDKPVED